jgi:hypothetical protein
VVIDAVMTCIRLFAFGGESVTLLPLVLPVHGHVGQQEWQMTLDAGRGWQSSYCRSWHCRCDAVVRRTDASAAGSCRSVVAQDGRSRERCPLRIDVSATRNEMLIVSIYSL